MSNKTSKLVLGWATTPTLEPKYWVEKQDAKPGEQNDEEDLVSIDPTTLDTHTAIIAQSGSGKSFFLGRLIEEIVLKTKARCVILDPNADFRKIYEAQPSRLWEEASYDAKKAKGKLPHESSRDEFVKKWPHADIRVIGAGTQNVQPSESNHRPFKVHWSSISVDFMADELESSDQSDLRLCHEFVRDVEHFFQNLALDEKQQGGADLLESARQLLTMSFKEKGSKRFLDSLTELVAPGEKKAEEKGKDVWKALSAGISYGFLRSDIKIDDDNTSSTFTINDILKRRPSDFPTRIADAHQTIREDISRFYFSRATEYSNSELLETELSPKNSDNEAPPRIGALDLASFQSPSAKTLAVHSFLEKEWDLARMAWQKALELNNPEKDDKRVPTFIIVDEAHNLIPTTPKDKAASAIKEQFVRIISEGRKYGLFLILVTQRPDKIDPMVLSECENYALMKISNARTLDLCKTLMDIEDIPPRTLPKCLEFKVGRVLLAGRWAPPGNCIMFSAARRTVEGGRSLQSNHWACCTISEDAVDSPEKDAANKFPDRESKIGVELPSPAVEKKEPL